jgi:hypothetical protein
VERGAVSVGKVPRGLPTRLIGGPPPPPNAMIEFEATDVLMTESVKSA